MTHISITRRQWVMFALVQLTVVGLAGVAWLYVGQLGLVIVPLLEGAWVAGLLLHYLQHTRKLIEERLENNLTSSTHFVSDQAKWIMGHAEASIAIYSTLDPLIPLPAMQGWAATSDLIAAVMREVLITKPRLVVEASSGVSTLTIGYCLKHIGAGRVIALEHDESYAIQTRQVIAAHGLEKYAQVVHAPLVPYVIQGETYPWYDWTKAEINEPISLLVVDGPPMNIRKNARLPALPLLLEKFEVKASVFLDDGRRDDEAAIAKYWQGLPGVDKVTYLNLQKGAWRIDINREPKGGK